MGGTPAIFNVLLSLIRKRMPSKVVIWPYAQGDQTPASLTQHVTIRSKGPQWGLCLELWLMGGISLLRSILSPERHYVSEMDQKAHFFPPSLAKRFIWVICKFNRFKALSLCRSWLSYLLWSLIQTLQSLGHATIKRTEEILSVSQQGSWHARPGAPSGFLLPPSFLLPAVPTMWQLRTESAARARWPRGQGSSCPFPLVWKWPCIPPEEALQPSKGVVSNRHFHSEAKTNGNPKPDFPLVWNACCHKGQWPSFIDGIPRTFLSQSVVAMPDRANPALSLCSLEESLRTELEKADDQLMMKLASLPITMNGFVRPTARMPAECVACIWRQRMGTPLTINIDELSNP